MKRYLATLHTKPERHKKRFALLVSGATTLLIFSVWGLVNFGTGGLLAQDNPQDSVLVANAVQSREVGPLESLKTGMAASWEGLSEIFDTMKAGFGVMTDLEADYTEMKSNVLSDYAQ